MLDFVGRLEALSAQLPVHLLLGHLPLDQTAIEDEELSMVLDQLKRHLIVEGRISQLLVFFGDARNEEQVLEAHF